MVGDNAPCKELIRIANCSGFYGDRLSAAREMVEGGPINVLTGDYLAELTMAILHGKKAKDPSAGYAGTFVKQVKEVLASCHDKGIKIVSNAGGLNPESCAQTVRAVCAELGLTAKVAWIDGDDLMPRLNSLQNSGNLLTNIDTGKALLGSPSKPLTANAYLGAWGIKAALDKGADIVICGRVTDAALVIGPAAWKFNWQRDDYDALAGALIAGHIIECGTQATGGNYAFFQEVPSFHNVGFPIAEIETDGSFTIAKHPGTGGLVSVGTITSQLVYEINTPAYLNPDVTAHIDSLLLEQVGPDRVRVTDCKGSSPPSSHKVCINTDGGLRTSAELLLTGLDIDAKAKIFTDELFASVGGREKFDSVTEALLRTDKENPKSNDEATATLRIIVNSRDANRVGRIFAAKLTELALASYPGFYGRTAATSSGPVIEHWSALIDSRHIVERLHMDNTVTDVLPTSLMGLAKVAYQSAPYQPSIVPSGKTIDLPLGRLFGARSGDKGGNANLGVWAKTDETFSFLYEFLTVDCLKQLLPDIADYPIDRYELPNINALNFYIRGVLGDGIAASTRTDGQAKSLGEYLRAKVIEVPKVLVDAAQIEFKDELQ